jgi:drug/metabolite transporter (DMT)-like permease
MGKGEAFALLSAALWAYGVILYKRLGESVRPLALNLQKNLIVLALIVPTWWIADGGVWPRLDAYAIASSCLSGAVGIALADTLYFRALNLVGAGRVGILGNLYSPLVLVLSFAVLGERLTALQFAGFGLVSTGVLIVSQAGASALPTDAKSLRRGIAYGIAAVALMAGSVVMVKRVLEAEPLLPIVTLRLVGGVVGLCLLIPLSGSRVTLEELVPRRVNWWLLLRAAAFGQYFSMLAWLAGYKYTSASVAAILNETASIFIVVLAWLLLGESMTRRKIVGAAFTVTGVACRLSSGRRSCPPLCVSEPKRRTAACGRFRPTPPEPERPAGQARSASRC